MFAALASAGVHAATGVGPVATVLHNCVPDGTQTAAPVAAVQPHRVAVQLLALLAATGVQEPTVTAAVVTTGQVVATQPLPDAAAAAVHAPVGVGPLVAVLQVVAV